ncbi:MAG: heavy metal-associated domain-containing protein [Bryobacteraceae bacterium]
MATQTIYMMVRGMTCGNCARGVERKLASTPGVVKATVDLTGGRAAVEYEAGVASPESLASAVRQLGYEVAV